MSEVWKPIPGTDGFYEASSLGRVRSLDRVLEVPCRWGGTRPMPCRGRIVKPWSDASGYLVVYLPKRKAVNIHRLVALAFHGEHHHLHVNHKDGDKTNNRADNLEWCTRSENIAHAIETGLFDFGKPVLRIASDGTVKQFESINSAARELGKGHSSIQRALSGRYRQAHGFRWKHAA